MRILVLSDNFVPETNAPALRVFDHCRRWVQNGAHVTVITGVPNFPTGRVQPPYRNRLYQREVIDGVEVVRVWTFLAPNVGTVLRSLDFISYAVTSFAAGLGEKFDVIVATSPQMLTGLSGAVLATVKRRPWVFEVRDLWPDSITAVGAMRNGPLISFLHWLERRLYASASRIVTVTDALKVAIAAKGVDVKKISVVPNGASNRLKAGNKDPELAVRLNLKGKFVVGYVGTHGLAHDLETVLNAAEILRDHDDIRFLFVGDGARRTALQALAAERQLTKVSFVGPVATEHVSDYLAQCGALIVPLKNSSIAAGAIPSKIFDAAAMERPIVLGIPGIAAALIARYQAGLVVEPESAPAMADAIRQLADNPELCATLGEGGRALAKAFERETLADEMLATISTLVRETSPER